MPRRCSRQCGGAAFGGARRAPRGDKPPTWRGSIVRGVVASLVFTVLLLAIFGRSVGAALSLGAFMLVFYIPAGYYIDMVMWRRRERAKMCGAGSS